MLPTTVLEALLVAPLLIVAAAFLGVSALVSLRGRPLVVRGQLFPLSIAAAWLPLAAATIVIARSAPDPGMTCIAAVQVGVVVLLIVGTRKATRGYVVLAVNGVSLRRALRAAIAELGFPVEETILGFPLGTIRNTLRLQFESHLGTAHLHLEAPGDPEVLSRIAASRRDHLMADEESASHRAAVIYGALGLAGLVIALYQSSRL